MLVSFSQSCVAFWEQVTQNWEDNSQKSQRDIFGQKCLLLQQEDTFATFINAVLLISVKIMMPSSVPAGNCSCNWTEVVLFSLLYQPPTQPPSHPASRNSFKIILNKLNIYGKWILMRLYIKWNTFLPPSLYFLNNSETLFWYLSALWTSTDTMWLQPNCSAWSKSESKD